MTDSQIDQLIAAARELSPAERLRVGLRVLEGLPPEDRRLVVQEAGPSDKAASPPTAASMLGLFAHEPDLVDDVCRQVYADRGTIQPRPVDE